MGTDPRHIAIIPDGNRRWAKAHGLAIWEGHKRGFKQFKPLLTAAFDEGVYCVSAWMASMDNLTKRSHEEVKFLYKAFESMFNELYDAPEIYSYDVRIQAFGEWESFQPSSLVASIRRIIEKTKEHRRHLLNLFDGYDGISEMTRAVQTIADLKTVAPDLKVTPELIKAHLYTRDLPPVDLVIRTGGEPHWSGGFLMWDIANAHFHFSEKMWPDFDEKDLLAALEDYRKRERRLGK